LRLIKATDTFLEDITAGTASASKAVVLGADKKIDTLDITALKLGGTAVSATAAEINVLDGVTRGSIVLGKSTGTGVLDASGDGNILIGDGDDLKSVSVSGDITITNTGVVSLALPKISVISKSCAIGDFTDNLDATGYIDMGAGVLPAGAIPLGWKAVVTTGFIGDTSAVISVGVAGDLARFTADATQSVFGAATVGSGVPQDKSCDGIAAAQNPRITITSAADFTNVSAGEMTVYLYFIQT
jgi:hypothetical protein